MMIGDFQSTQDGFAGRIRTLMLDAAVTLVPAPANDSENAPDWRVLLGDADTGIEIGAGWNRTGERAGVRNVPSGSWLPRSIPSPAAAPGASSADLTSAPPTNTS